MNFPGSGTVDGKRRKIVPLTKPAYTAAAHK
jgi:hypothetical protein